MTEYLVERDGESVNCEIYGNSDYDLRFYPENNMIVWDDIVLTKDSYETEFIVNAKNNFAFTINNLFNCLAHPLTS